MKDKELSKEEFVKLDKEVDRLLKENTQNMIKLAKLLYEIKEKELWKGGGYKSFTEYIEEKKGLSKTYASLLVYICKLGLIKYIETGTIGWNKAYILLPTLKKLPTEKREEVIELAKQTPLPQLRTELITEGYYKQSPDKEIQVFTISFSGSKAEIDFIRNATEQISKAMNITNTEVIINALYLYLEQDKENHIEKKTSEINKLSRKFSDLFIQKYQEYCKTKYMFRGVKDKKLCDKLVSVFTLSELEKALDKFFTIKGKEKWWNSYNIGAFYTAINDLTREEPIKKGKYDKIMEQARKELEEENEEEK